MFERVSSICLDAEKRLALSDSTRDPAHCISEDFLKRRDQHRSWMCLCTIVSSNLFRRLLHCISIKQTGAIS